MGQSSTLTAGTAACSGTARHMPRTSPSRRHRARPQPSRASPAPRRHEQARPEPAPAGAGGQGPSGSWPGTTGGVIVAGLPALPRFAEALCGKSFTALFQGLQTIDIKRGGAAARPDADGGTACLATSRGRGHRAARRRRITYENTRRLKYVQVVTAKTRRIAFPSSENALLARSPVRFSRAWPPNPLLGGCVAPQPPWRPAAAGGRAAWGPRGAGAARLAWDYGTGGFAVAEFTFSELLPTGPDTTEYRLVSGDGVSSHSSFGRKFLEVEPQALTLLT